MAARSASAEYRVGVLFALWHSVQHLFFFDGKSPFEFTVATYLMDNMIFHSRALAMDLDQCAVGAPSRQPTRLECSNELFESLAST